jgi:APA family basic amino acid/polyamine antiporter
VGPRVTRAMAVENKLWQPLSGTNRHGIPVAALWAHVIIAILLTFTGSFERVLLYAGFVLQLMASLTVASCLFLPLKRAASFRSPYKPWLQLVFLVFTGWTLVFTLVARPVESLIGVGVLLTGGIIYYFDQNSLYIKYHFIDTQGFELSKPYHSVSCIYTYLYDNYITCTSKNIDAVIHN